MGEINQETPGAKLIWRPPYGYVSLFFLAFGIFGVTVAATELPDNRLLGLLLLAAYIPWSLVCLGAVVYNFRARVESDEAGLHWRDWRGVWRAATWNEIEDFWLTSARGREKKVRTAQGKLSFGSVQAGDVGDVLAARIAARATAATAREWGVLGERLCDPWPRRFAFWRRSLVWALCATLAVLMVLVAWVALALQIAPRAVEVPFGSWFLASIGPLLLVATFPLLLLIIAIWSLFRAWPWRAHSVEVSPAGLVWLGPMRIQVSWAQIESWRWIVRGRTRVLSAQTAQGAIEIPAFIGGFYTLCRILENFSGVDLNLESLDQEILAMETVAPAPDGTLNFRFNAYFVRLICGMLAAFGAMILALPWLFALADPQTLAENQGMTNFGIFVLVAALAIWIWARLSRVIVSDEALEWRAPGWRRRVNWSEIESFGVTSGAPWLVAGGRKISLLWIMEWVPQTAQLRAEIARRAINARGSWENAGIKR